MITYFILKEKVVSTYLLNACVVTISDNRRAHTFITPGAVKNWADDYKNLLMQHSYKSFCSLWLLTEKLSFLVYFNSSTNFFLRSLLYLSLYLHLAAVSFVPD